MAGTLDASVMRDEGVALRLFGITEAFLDSLASQELVKSVDMSIAIILRLVEDYEIHATSNWSERNKAYKKYYSINLDRCARATELRAAREVRNCLAHGLGVLTARQRTMSRLALDLSVLDISVSDGRMIFGPKTVSSFHSACKEFIVDVDRRMPILAE
ncbi:hypothetical protein [Actinopolymorpha singaporensis]|uniref:hypothetical protein n=1 Tax=Actinopolymorpha singaporensis TaxID=117157 RepID=UPI0012FDBCB3|nr:hypothetical protein [Actinopolymorpha singaporensis]